MIQGQEYVLKKNRKIYRAFDSLIYLHHDDDVCATVFRTPVSGERIYITDMDIEEVFDLEGAK